MKNGERKAEIPWHPLSIRNEQFHPDLGELKNGFSKKSDNFVGYRKTRSEKFSEGVGP